MMRTLEVVIVISILLGAFAVVSYFTVLPLPRQVAPLNLRRLALTTLQTLDSDHDLSTAAFDTENYTTWNHIQVALSAILPADIVYNLTILEVNSEASGTELYTPVKSVSNAGNLGAGSDASQYSLASSNVTFNVTPEKIGEHGNGGTLYILNCSDANGWWITGYTAQSLADDFYKLLSPYFVNTILVQNTTQLRQLLDNQTISGSPSERVQNAVVINTFGECVPMPQEYYQGNSRASQGYDPVQSSYGYVKYCHTLGNLTRTYNWTWASIVGYPFYYVSNTAVFSNEQNSWGIYGMRMTSQGGSRAFLQGLDNQNYVYNDTAVTDSATRQVTLTQTALDSCNYYGIYPSTYQTSTRALSDSIRQSYNLSIGLNVFNPVSGYNPGSIYTHVSASGNVAGSLLAIGLTRTPDVRVTAISLLSYYQPRLYRSEYTAYGTSRLAVLQLGLAGGVGA